MKSIVYGMLCCVTLVMGLSTLGCSPYWYREHHNVKVADSRFNRLQITCQFDEDKPRVNCEINGNGNITLVEGHSTSVSDQFSINQAGTYGDVKKYTVNIPPAEVQIHLQTLVDAGLFDLEEADEDQPLFPRILLAGRVNGIKVDKFTFKEELIMEVRSLLFEYKVRGGASF